MPRKFTEQIFRTTYRDDYTDSDNYSRILFNSGRALQARELTQLQTIIQKEISRFGSNIFKDGAMVNPGGININNNYEFIKIQGSDPVFDNVDDLQDVVLTGQTSGIKVKVYQAVAAVGSDPDTLYVKYLDLPSGATTVAERVTPGERLSNGSDINIDVQSTNTSANPAVGKGSLFSVTDGSFFVQGHFVFAPNQSIIVSKYNNFPTKTVGFKITQDIVTVADTDALYDNQGVTPNRSSPGADRYRIKLTLTTKDQVRTDENFVYLASLVAGKIKDKPTGIEGYNQINRFVSQRIDEINGDFIKRYFKTYFEPNNATQFKLRVEPGTAYVRGNRIDKDKVTTLVIPKAQETFTQENEQISLDYGNYFVWNTGQGMLNFDECEKVELKSGFDNTGTVIGTANVRAISEGANGNYNVYLFNIDRTSVTQTLREVKSVVSVADGDYVNLVLNASGQSILQENQKKTLLIDTPVGRPKLFNSITVTGAQRQAFSIVSGSTYTIQLNDANESFVNESDIIISSSTEAVASGVSANITGSQTLQITGLTVGVAYQVLYYVRKTNQSPRTKTLTELTLTTTLDSDGTGLRYVPLGQSDIFSVNRIRVNDSDGEDIFTRFYLDAGARDTHYDDGRLIYKGAGLDSANQPVFVRFKYFLHEGTGPFFAANSYTGQVEYRDIPAHTLQTGSKVSLRDVLDFRPSTDGSGSFVAGTVFPLPQPTDTVVADAEYYLPRNDKLVLSKTGELRYLTGTSSLTPKYPSTPVDCIDLYKYELNANTLHIKDLKSTIIPMKGYTMEDISKLEKRLDKVEELTTLSLLELATNNLRVLDSAGADRTKSGFFVDNFSNQIYSDTKNPEYRASLDPRSKLVRPTFKEESVDLYYDSENLGQLRTVQYGDNIYLAHKEVPWLAVDIASKTENLNPFFVERTVGNIRISPESDFWKESQKAAPRIVDGGTELDTRQALLWNNWEWNWNGVDVNELQVGQTSSNVTGTSTTTTVNRQEPRLTGQNVTEEVGEWVVTGTTSSTEELSSQDVVISVDTEEVFRPAVEDEIVEGLDASRVDLTGWQDTVESTTRERRTQLQTTDTTTLEQTTRVITENEFTESTELVTNTSTTTTVNRIASESTVREVVGSRVIDVALIPWMRTRTITFRADGLRPNTRYFPFFDGTIVSDFCRSESGFQTIAERNRNDSVTGNEARVADERRPTIQHSQGATDLFSDANGRLIGSFEIPNHSAMRFRTGTREFALYDISAYNSREALSIATTFYHARGELETIQDTVRSTRVLQVVGSATTNTSTDVAIENTISTEVLIDENVSQDVITEQTITEVVGDQTTTIDIVDTQPVIVIQPEPIIEPVPTVDPVEPEEEETVRPPLEPTPILDPAPAPSEPAPAPSEPAPAPSEPAVVEPVEEDEEILPIFGTPNVAGFFAVPDLWDDRQMFRDPLAQTFAVDDPNGIFVTRIRVYFASKDDEGIPVFLEIRPTQQGTPDANKVLATVSKAASQVNVVPNPDINTMLGAGTDFILDEPLYLTGSTEFALILRSNSMKYRIYISEVEDFVLGSTERRITKQPYLGSLFKSQNSRIWEPAQRQDMAFRIYRAEFETSGNAVLENAIVPPAALTRDPFVMDSGSNTLTVIQRGHGLQPGDTTFIRGIDSATDFGNGVTGVDVLGPRTVLDVDGGAYTVAADAVSTKNLRFGGGQVTGSQNLVFDTLRPTLEVLQPETTNVTISGKFSTAKSLAGNETPYTKDNAYRLLTNKKNMDYQQPRAIYSYSNEERPGGLNGEKSATLQVSMTTTDNRVSPIIDLQRCGLVTIGNLIDKQDSAATSGFNVPLNFVDETNPQFGSSLAKHITIPTTLQEEAVGLRLIVAANRPPAASFKMYYRTADEGQNIRSRNWVLVDPESTLPSDTNRSIFREYRYLVGGLGGAMEPFTQFQVKIVMESTNSSQVPVFRDLRAIALAV